MRKMIRYAILALPLFAAAWTAGEQLMLQPQSKLWVEGGSTIKSWNCKATDVEASVEGVASSVSQVLAGEKAVKTVDVSLIAEKIDCSNGTMNDHMKKALKVGEHPTITFKLTTYDVSKSADGVSGTLNGTLTLGGVKKQIAIPATGVELGGALRVTGAYELKMTDYELKPPTLMFGRIKVRDEVTVKFDLVLKS